MGPHPWDSPGKKTGVGCHFLLQCIKVKSESEVTQLYPTLCDPTDCGLPGSSVHGIFQARVLEWGAIAFSIPYGNQSLFPHQQHWRSWIWTVLWRPAIPSRINTQKRYPFHYRWLEFESSKSRNTWSNRKFWPWNTEWSRAKTSKVLPREYTGHSKHPLPTTQKTLHGHYQIVNTKIILIIFFAVKDGEALQSQKKTRLGDDCGSYHELLIAKFRLKLKKVGKTTRLFRYDLNQILNIYTMEVRNRFKGLDLI